MISEKSGNSESIIYSSTILNFKFHHTNNKIYTDSSNGEKTEYCISFENINDLSLILKKIKSTQFMEIVKNKSQVKNIYSHDPDKAKKKHHRAHHKDSISTTLEEYNITNKHKRSQSANQDYLQFIRDISLEPSKVTGNKSDTENDSDSFTQTSSYKTTDNIDDSLDIPPPLDSIYNNSHNSSKVLTNISKQERTKKIGVIDVSSDGFSSGNINVKLREVSENKLIQNSPQEQNSDLKRKNALKEIPVQQNNSLERSKVSFPNDLSININDISVKVPPPLLSNSSLYSNDSLNSKKISKFPDISSSNDSNDSLNPQKPRQRKSRVSLPPNASLMHIAPSFFSSNNKNDNIEFPGLKKPKRIPYNPLSPPIERNKNEKNYIQNNNDSFDDNKSDSYSDNEARLISVSSSLNNSVYRFMLDSKENENSRLHNESINYIEKSSQQETNKLYSKDSSKALFPMLLDKESLKNNDHSQNESNELKKDDIFDVFGSNSIKDRIQNKLFTPPIGSSSSKFSVSINFQKRFSLGDLGSKEAVTNPVTIPPPLLSDSTSEQQEFQDDYSYSDDLEFHSNKSNLDDALPQNSLNNDSNNKTFQKSESYSEGTSSLSEGDDIPPPLLSIKAEDVNPSLSKEKIINITPIDVIGSKSQLEALLMMNPPDPIAMDSPQTFSTPNHNEIQEKLQSGIYPISANLNENEYKNTLEQLNSGTNTNSSNSFISPLPNIFTALNENDNHNSDVDSLSASLLTPEDHDSSSQKEIDSLALLENKQISTNEYPNTNYQNAGKFNKLLDEFNNSQKTKQQNLLFHTSPPSFMYPSVQSSNLASLSNEQSLLCNTNSAIANNELLYENNDDNKSLSDFIDNDFEAQSSISSLDDEDSLENDFKTLDHESNIKQGNQTRAIINGFSFIDVNQNDLYLHYKPVKYDFSQYKENEFAQAHNINPSKMYSYQKTVFSRKLKRLYSLESNNYRNAESILRLENREIQDPSDIQPFTLFIKCYAKRVNKHYIFSISSNTPFESVFNMILKKSNQSEDSKLFLYKGKYIVRFTKYTFYHEILSISKKESTHIFIIIP